MCRALIILALLVLAACRIIAIPTDNIIPSSREVDWDKAGLDGNIWSLMINETQTLSSAMTIYTNLNTNGFTVTILNNAIQACPSNQVVQLTNGVYWVDGAINEKSGVTIRGVGQWNTNDNTGTLIKVANPFSGQAVFLVQNGYDDDWNANTAVNLTNCLKGSYNITSMVAHGLSVGDIVIIDQLEWVTTLPPVIESRDTFHGRDTGNRAFGQFATVTNVPSSTTAILDYPLIYSFTNDATPQSFEATGWTYRFNIESLTIDTLDETGSDAHYSIWAIGWVNSWIYDVEFKGCHNRGIWGYAMYKMTIQKCYFHGNRPIGNDYDAHYASNRGYGIYYGPHCSQVAVVDSIFSKLTNPISHEGAGSTLVAVACLFTNTWWFATGENEAPLRFGPLMHGPYPSFVLITESHIEGRARADDQFGSSGFWTYFRNRIMPRDRRTNTVTGTAFQWSCVELEKQNHFYSFVGNILGSGKENDYIKNGTTYDENVSKLIWETGYDLNSDQSTGHDTNVLYTLIRWLNFDYLQNAVSNHTENVGNTSDTTLDDSMVFTNKPSWFFGLDWPIYDATTFSTNNPALGNPTNMPAGWRYVHALAAGTVPGRTNPPAAAVGGGEGAGNQYRNRGKSRVSGFSPVF